MKNKAHVTHLPFQTSNLGQIQGNLREKNVVCLQVSRGLQEANCAGEEDVL